MSLFGDSRIPDRFWSKVLINEAGCWIWTACKNTCGYASCRVEGKTKTAHRVFFKCLAGEIPEGLHLDHLCRVRNCVNPHHLEHVTPKENTRRGEVGGTFYRNKTSCPLGHLYTEENTYIRSTPSGLGRNCRVCGKINAQRYRDRKKAQDL